MLSPREAALKIIYDTFEKGSYLNIAYKNITDRENFSPKDSAFVKELAFGTVKHKITVDYIIRHFLKNKKTKISPYVLNILRLGVYQLKFTDKIPDFSAVNEAVILAEKYGGKSSKGFVNGILRSVAREDVFLLKKGDKGYLSLKYSFTPSMAGALKKAYGEDFTEALMAAMNLTPEISLRTNTLKISRSDLIDILNKNGISATENEKTPAGIIVCGTGKITGLKEYKDGLFSVQDTASQHAALTLNPKKSETVFDICSSPGGKTTHMAELMENTGEIFAFELYEKRLLSVEENAKRLGIDIIKTKAHDGTILIKELVGKADKILLDAPCSGWGVIRRKPDIKYKSELTDYKELTATQKKLIATASAYLKTGGEMVYSTCTLNKGENEKVIEHFLSENKGFSLVSQKTYFPHIDGCDGFFVAKLKKDS